MSGGDSDSEIHRSDYEPVASARRLGNVTQTERGGWMTRPYCLIRTPLSQSQRKTMTTISGEEIETCCGFTVRDNKATSPAAE
jgi:hypothetical protein